MNSFLLKDVRIFDGETEVANGSVLVKDGIITKVSSSSLDPPSSSIKVISKPGHTVLPGLIDCHIHADGANPVALPQSLSFGVTTVCDMHNEPANVVKLRKQAEDKSSAADFKTCSVAATIENGWPVPVVTAHDKSEKAGVNARLKTAREIATWPKLETAQDAQNYVEERVAEKVDYIKLMHESGSPMGFEFNKPSQSLQAAVVKAAHKHGLLAVAHSLALRDTIEVLGAGVDGMTHTICDAAPTEELIQAYKKNNAHCNPTLAAIGSLTTEGQQMQEAFAHDERAARLLGDVERERMCQCMAMAKEKGKVEYAYESVKKLKAAGIDILCGSDSAGPAVGTAWGLSMHHELSLFVNKCGFTPAEALRAATVLPAKRFGFTDRGRIAEGLKADLLLIEGNPLDDISKTLDLRAVWRDGMLCSKYV
ncbi:hypothetical protein LTR66_003609 [Elasticomyces elasticus]|nr:hypothetical protein LTR66_003609 [Elasticomyces elasticus]KAK5010597.1 hypothetical protein LTR28_008857 [Elasticomyces elasticus]